MRPLEAPPRLAAQQSAFAAHLRDPERAPAPAGIEARRLQVYRELFFNTVEGLLAAGFPVLRGLRDDAWWLALVRDFYREHRAHTPLFPEIGRELLRYLEDRGARAGDPPFLLELAHYEWIEVALINDDSALEDGRLDPDGDLLAETPVLSPRAWPLAYRFPVHRIGAGFQPEQPGEAPTCLLLVRGDDDRVAFKEIDLVGFRLLQAIGDNSRHRSGAELLTDLALEAGAEVAAFLDGGLRLLEQLRQRGAILGTRPRGLPASP